MDTIRGCMFAHHLLSLFFVHRWFFGYLGLYLAVVGLILPPSLPYFLSDDGDYTATVLDWKEEGTLRISDYPSMSLIGHLAWGYCFVSLFGTTAGALKVSSMVMAWLGGLSIYDIIYHYRRNSQLAAFAAATYVFSPLVFYYSYTFNTDVAGNSTMLFFMALANRLRQPMTIKAAMTLGGLAAFCFLVRQTAAIPALVLSGWMLGMAISRRQPWLPIVIYGSCFAIPIATYFAYLEFIYGWPLGYEQRFLSLEVILKPKIAIVKSLRMVLSLVLLVLPMVWLYAAKRNLAIFNLPWLVMLSTTLTVAMFGFDSLIPIRPYWGIDIYNAGCGSIFEILGLSSLLTSWNMEVQGYYFSTFELLSVLMSLLGSLIIFNALGCRNGLLAYFRKTLIFPRWDLRWFIVLTVIAQFGLALIIWVFYDRYLMPLVSLVILLLGLSPILRSANLWLGHLGFFLLMALSVIGVQDAIVQCETAWKVAEQLEAQGIPPYNIWIGHQYFVFKAYRPLLRSEMSKQQNKLGKLERNHRKAMALWNRKAQYRVQALQNNEPFRENLPFIERRSWIRSYRFQALKIEELPPYHERFQTGGS